MTEQLYSATNTADTVSWASVSNITIATDAELTQPLYINGLNMLKVYVTFIAYDKDGNTVSDKIDPDTLKSCTRLMNYTSKSLSLIHI